MQNHLSDCGRVSVDFEVINFQRRKERPSLDELVSNACKHAFPNGETGSLKVRLKQKDQWVHLTVQDSGVGLTPGVDIAGSETLGLTIVRLLIAQLGGQLSLSNGRGTCVEMQFLASK